jgi:serine/threonine protein kinase
VLLKTTYSAELMDVWCLGATFFTMMAGENPFTGDNEKKKSNIINCKWNPKSFFSQKVCKFLSSIFT